MRVNLNLQDALLEKVDAKSKELGITRTAFVSMALADKLNNYEVMDKLPIIQQMFSDATRLDYEASARIFKEGMSSTSETEKA